MIVDELIFDRTLGDVNEAKIIQRKILTEGLSALSETEHDAWFGEMKGACDATTLNRIGNAINYIVSGASAKGITIAASGKTDWTMQGVPTTTDMTTLIGNLNAIKTAIPQVDLPLPVSMDFADYKTLNQIEHFLHDACLEVIE